ncbi:MAG: beta-galactosidase [Phaeodactylibacter xiamenensis]|uniref:beta-galactosidase n=1 Tax=Phaeodactylibacter xiamenensis TaxID=1524460 RepID=UPI0007C8FDD7|nr:beta-galactosidase [Phaeodactylibacter xiamenensis]MCR9053461.1 beta-galactosidase [bacterium]
MLKFNSLLLSLLFAGLPLLLCGQETDDQAIPADKIYYGASYYPETWPRERVSEDIQHMKELFMNVVRMAEFSWSKMEPREGEYDMEALPKRVRSQLSGDTTGSDPSVL